MGTKRRVLFVCTGNTCRSVLAEYLGRKFLSSNFLFESAEIKPQEAEDAENAVFILRDRFSISTHLRISHATSAMWTSQDSTW